MGSPSGAVVRICLPMLEMRDKGSIPGSGRSPRGGNGNLLQYSGLSRKILWREQPGGLQSRASQSDVSEHMWLHTHTHTHTRIRHLNHFASSDAHKTQKMQSKTAWLLDIYPKELKIDAHKNLHVDTDSSYICNCQHLQATKMSFSRWMDKLISPNNRTF